jgi:hypothetical protein
VDQVFTVRRRQIGAQELELIQALIRQEGARGRTHISNRLCEIWDWRQANGRFRQITCRDLLRQLEARQLIKLPPMLKPARRPGYINRVPPPELLERAPLLGNAGALRSQIRLELAREGKHVQLFNCLVGACHYLGYQQPTGAQLKYLAFFEERPIACLSFGPAAFKVAPRDQFIGWNPAQRIERLPWVVNNDRFLIAPWVSVRALSSWLLSRCLRRLRQDWQEVYCHDLALAETFVQQDCFEGTSYAAANWLCLGQTQGRGRNDRLNEAALPIKTIWIHPLRKDFRKMLCGATR